MSNCNHSDIFNGVCGVCLMPIDGVEHDNKGNIIKNNSSFKSQLQAFVNEAAKNHGFGWNPTLTENTFKSGCNFLIPVLMRAIEQRHDAYFETDSTYTQLESSFNKELLNILKGEG